MPIKIKFTCKCGVPILAFTKKPGESITCHNCGAELVVPQESNQIHITGVIHTLKPDEIEAMKKKAKEEKGDNDASS
jgi:hypothetical protein